MPAVGGGCSCSPTEACVVLAVVGVVGEAMNGSMLVGETGLSSESMLWSCTLGAWAGVVCLRMK